MLVAGSIIPVPSAAAAAPGMQDLLIYVGTYTGPQSRGIYAFRQARGEAVPEALGCVAEATHPSFLAFPPSGRFVYAVSEVGGNGHEPGGRVIAWARDPASGRLSRLNAAPSGGDGPCHLAVDFTGQHVLVAHYGSGSVAVLPIRADGSLGAPTCVVPHTGSSVHPRRQRQPHVHAVNLAPDNRHALVADLGTDRVVVYRFDAAQGRLEPAISPALVLPPGSGPRHLAFHPRGRWVFVLNELSSQLALAEYDAATGRLDLRQLVSTLPADFRGENATAEVAVHPNGRWVYASNRGHDSVAVFAFAADPAPRLEVVQHQPTGGRTPRHFALDPSGQTLWVANQASDTVVIFRVEAATGRLSDTDQVLRVPSPVCVRFWETPPQNSR